MEQPSRSLATAKPRQISQMLFLKWLKIGSWRNEAFVYAAKIRERLLRKNKGTPGTVPSARQIQNAVLKNIGMTYNKLTSVPIEYNIPENLAKVNEYLETDNFKACHSAIK